MRLSSLSDQAVVLMQAASARCGGEAARGALTSAAELAAATGIHVPTAQKLVSLLTRAGLLNSARGSGGGIRLARSAATISLADVVEAVEGPIALTACVEKDGAHVCEREAACAVRPHWSAVNDAVRGALAHVSLASLSAPVPSPVPAFGATPILGALA
ncbi:Rrf2 family transcriptional regulator [Sphingobium sufflavum]|uniref:RrF2 family transcriptional regulator n=1 Tax=Sphingobium sufflavum TaxID=1129547 RepID=UPI001F3D1286|nr:Rrf2 family transcriptional regulator [Sphingobium sufflavum]MCE7795167.1 Rrf2 family transcriptional regulator [Sphingobium sufflavum]